MRIAIGFMIIDDDTRFIVIEGLGGAGQSMQRMHMDIASHPKSDHSSSNSNSNSNKNKSSSSTVKMLLDPETLFSTRLYSSFG